MHTHTHGGSTGSEYAIAYKSLQFVNAFTSLRFRFHAIRINTFAFITLEQSLSLSLPPISNWAVGFCDFLICSLQIYRNNFWGLFRYADSV